MTNIKHILKDFNALQDARRKSTLQTKLAFLFCAVSISLVLLFCYSLLGNVTGRILVVNEGGEYLRMKSVDQDELYISLLESHCYYTACYLNSFDRLSIEENRARALFLVNKPDANTVFAKYQADRAYGDAIDLGVVYKTDFEKIRSLTVRGDEYRVVYSSVLSIINGSETRRIRIVSTGVAVRTTPRFPENTTGFFFRKYNQEYQVILNKE